MYYFSKMPSHDVSLSFLFAVRARATWRVTRQWHSQGQGNQGAPGTSLGMGTGKGQAGTGAHGCSWLRGPVVRRDRAGDRSCCGMGRVARDSKS